MAYFIISNMYICIKDGKTSLRLITVQEEIQKARDTLFLQDKIEGYKKLNRKKTSWEVRDEIMHK